MIIKIKVTHLAAAKNPLLINNQKTTLNVIGDRDTRAPSICRLAASNDEKIMAKATFINITLLSILILFFSSKSNASLIPFPEIFDHSSITFDNISFAI